MAAPSDQVIQHLAEAEAALWLAESLILSLVRAGILEKQTAIEAIEATIEAKRSVLPETPSPEIARLAIGILSALGNSIAATPEPQLESREPPKRSGTPRHSASK
jgi:hypothetical protein